MEEAVAGAEVLDLGLAEGLLAIYRLGNDPAGCSEEALAGGFSTHTCRACTEHTDIHPQAITQQPIHQHIQQCSQQHTHDTANHTKGTGKTNARKCASSVGTRHNRDKEKAQRIREIIFFLLFFLSKGG